ncbi:hypothetical protein NXV35_25450 [Bacteroides faecis]|nr:hypothetical protein [Bacteroides faecis]
MGISNVVALTGQYTASGSAGTQDNTSFTKPFYHGGNSLTFLVENSWTPEHTNAEFRLGITGPSNNNGYSSTFWYRKRKLYAPEDCNRIGLQFPEEMS